MAEILSNEKNGKRRATRRSTRVDLTPMVDLGFLLITFFVFTTRMDEAKVLETKLPNDRDSSTEPVCESCALTIIPAKDNNLYYYEGMEQNADYKKTNYSAQGLRKLIVDKKQKVMNLMHIDKFVLIIKPSPGSNFKNLVDIMDEATICQVKRYYLSELNEAERKIVQ